MRSLQKPFRCAHLSYTVSWREDNFLWKKSLAQAPKACRLEVLEVLSSGVGLGWWLSWRIPVHVNGPLILALQNPIQNLLLLPVGSLLSSLLNWTIKQDMDDAGGAMAIDVFQPALVIGSSLSWL
jgi:hypothetical protein